MITAPKMARERRHPCLHDFIYCGQDGRAPGCIFIIACERSSWYLLRKWPGSAGILACMLSIYCGQDGRAPGCIFIIVCERSSWYLLRKWPGSAGIPACMIPSTAARMAALPGAFSLLCVSVAYDNCSENRNRITRFTAPKITPGSAGILACMISSTAARMAALPGTFSLLCMSVAHGIYYENAPGSAGIPSFMLSSTAARMAALPGTFSSSCVSVAHDNCSENGLGAQASLPA